MSSTEVRAGLRHAWIRLRHVNLIILAICTLPGAMAWGLIIGAGLAATHHGMDLGRLSALLPVGSIFLFYWLVPVRGIATANGKRRFDINCHAFPSLPVGRWPRALAELATGLVVSLGSLPLALAVYLLCACGEAGPSCSIRANSLDCARLVVLGLSRMLPMALPFLLMVGLPVSRGRVLALPVHAALLCGAGLLGWTSTLPGCVGVGVVLLLALLAVERWADALRSLAGRRRPAFHREAGPMHREGLPAWRMLWRDWFAGMRAPVPLVLAGLLLMFPAGLLMCGLAVEASVTMRLGLSVLPLLFLLWPMHLSQTVIGGSSGLRTDRTAFRDAWLAAFPLSRGALARQFYLGALASLSIAMLAFLLLCHGWMRGRGILFVLVPGVCLVTVMSACYATCFVGSRLQYVCSGALMILSTMWTIPFITLWAMADMHLPVSGAVGPPLWLTLPAWLAGGVLLPWRLLRGPR